MNVSLFIAKRYLFSKKSHNAINIISLISVVGIAIATMAMVCTLSIFNGFTDIVTQTFSSFDPELRVSSIKGKVFDPDNAVIKEITELPEIELFSYTIEENALLRFQDRQVPVVVKGVSPQFEYLASIDKIRPAALMLHGYWMAHPKAAPVQQPIRNDGKVGRNDPCPCGSGKKYKQCCANK